MTEPLWTLAELRQMIDHAAHLGFTDDVEHFRALIAEQS